MEIKKLQAISQKNEAPFVHSKYTVWLHNEIINEIRGEAEVYRETNPFLVDDRTFETIFNLPSLQPIK